MSEIKSVILGLCIASVSLGAMYMLRPVGATEKSVRLNFAVIFLSLLVVSVASLLGTDFGDMKISVDNSSSFYSENIVCAEVEYLCGEILKEKGMDFKEITVFTDKNGQGGISIKRITVESTAEPEAIRQSITAVIATDGVEVIND